MSGSGSSSSASPANDSFVLNIAFVHEPTLSGIGTDSPHTRPRTRSIDASSGIPSLTRAVSEVASSSVKDSPSTTSAPSLADVATASPHVPFGFISFPIPSLHTPAYQVTLAQVRQILPSQFPASAINNLISSGFISIMQARALQSGSYLFLHAPSSSPTTFLPVSSVQESHIFAHQCQPTLLLKSIKAPNAPIGDVFGKDSLPSAANLSQRRQSYDLTLQHQDSLAMLDASGMGGRNTSAFASPRGRQPSGNYSDQMPSVQLPPPSAGVAASDDEKHMEEDERGMFEGISRFFSRHSEREESSSSSKAPLPVAHRVVRKGDKEYRPLAPNLHFEDVIREKTIRHESPAPFPQKEPTLKITVTGEILETAKQKREATEQSRKRRATNVMELDEKEGSVKSFTNIEEFIMDEERRRAKYDAAAAAYLAAQATNETAAASTIASDPTDPIKKSPSAELLSPGSGKEPLPQTPLWISVEDGDDRTVDTIGQYFGLHPLTIEDCQSKGIREKLEVFPEYLFLVFHALEETHVHPGKSAAMNDLQADIMKTTPLKLVVFPSLVLSFHKGGLASVNTVRKQLDKLYRNRVLNTAWLIHGLLDVVSDSLMPVVDTAAKEADDMEDEVFIINPGRESHKEVLKRMGFIARRLTFLRQRLWSKRDILTSLIEKDWQGYLTGIRVPYLRDIYDHLVIMLHKMDAAIEVIVTLQNTYLAVVSIDVAAVSNEGNAAMKTLSAGATILLPLSLIASLMGMNVVVPFQYDMMNITFRDLVPFTSICLIMVIISFYLYLYFKRKSYL